MKEEIKDQPKVGHGRAHIKVKPSAFVVVIFAADLRRFTGSKRRRYCIRAIAILSVGT
jgi:hypothetical protein